MRKSGPFRSIRLCAYTAVGADAGVARIVLPGDDVSMETAEPAGWLASLVDRQCQATNTSKRTQTDIRNATRARIRFHLMGMVGSQEYIFYPGCPPRSGLKPEEKHLCRIPTLRSWTGGIPRYLSRFALFTLPLRFLVSTRFILAVVLRQLIT